MSWARAIEALCVMLLAVPVQAQEVSPTALAESLFQEGRKLMEERRIEEACRKFEESQRLVPKLGTLLNLATCHEQEGRTASAWAEFTQAATRAETERELDRVAYARSHLRALEGRLSRLALEVAQPSDDLTVFVGDAPLGRGAWDTPVTVDPGKLTIRAERRGTRWSNVV